ncbi:S8 family serine peptidase [Amaricoccus solimangrovi]|uniref:Peptidase S8 n=1 Tax=Amaricoccus solimangrovi TaxID=2589815 RepID=A0A501WNU9_9RHOB|nr:S8 family serine peptidase [Amaricoccus solimangrovi]TPE51008.1 peptidase S8 [Amaricoccus solimangrovi]
MVSQGWRTALLLAQLALLGCAGPAEKAPPPERIARDAADVVDPREIVTLVPDPGAADRLAAAATRRGYALARRSRLGALGFDQLVFRMPADRDGPEAIAEIEALEASATAGLNHAYRLQAGAAGAGRVYADRLLGWAEDGCPARVPIGMIDGPVDAAAPSLARARIDQKDFTGGPAGARHGTAVAEILAGPGRLSGAVIHSAAVVSDREDPEGAAGVDTLMLALDWLARSGVELVNVSLAGPYNKILDQGVRAADRRGMILVAAAGNTGADGPPRYPAAFPRTIAVTAIDAAARPYAEAPRGDHIDFAAPGVDIYLRLEGPGEYLSGTSLAAPYVTALLAGARLPRSAGAARDALAAEARDLGADGRDEVFGAGLPRPAPACRRG